MPQIDTWNDSVASITLDNTAVAQISVTPDGDGFLIRVWPPYGTAENGGGNITAFSAVFEVKGKVIEATDLQISSARFQRIGQGRKPYTRKKKVDKITT